MKKLFLVSLFLALAFNAQASTVNFEDNDVDVLQPGTFASGELTFTTTSGVALTSTSNPGSFNGTNALITGFGNGNGGSFSFKETNSSTFSLGSLDAGTTWGSDDFGGTGSVVLTGHQLGGGTLTKTLILGFSYSTYIFDWMNLLSVDVSENSNFGFVAFDNIDVVADTNGINPVPIPAAVWLFTPAIVSLIGIGKRKQIKTLAS
ncbi:MAG: hypothetical protein ABL884_10800 [Methyloglobulus sp.]